jgi:hypothetical protein
MGPPAGAGKSQSVDDRPAVRLSIRGCSSGTGTAVVLAGLELDALALPAHLRAAVPDDLGGVHEHVR